MESSSKEKVDTNIEAMKFTLRGVYKPIRPTAPKSIPPNTSIAELNNIEEWELHDGTQWIAYDITGKSLEFMAPPRQPMEMHEKRRKYADVRAVAQ